MRLNEAGNIVKRKAVNKLRTLGQTGSGRKTAVKKTGKRRKASPSTSRRKQVKKRGTAPVEDLFAVLPTQVRLDKSRWIDHQPFSGVSDYGPITFLSLEVLHKSRTSE